LLQPDREGTASAGLWEWGLRTLKAAVTGPSEFSAQY
jgi:hypothetical protein